jgi:putative transposase
VRIVAAGRIVAVCRRYVRHVPRPLRYQGSDVLYHVGSRAVDKQPIFGVVRWDREVFIGLIARVVRVYGWRCHAYCLMGNHFHLVVDTPGANLAAGMQYLKGVYAQWFNRFKGREGALFERRYWDRIAASELHVLELARYVALNPVRAGLCRAPEEWRWSSHAATAGLVRAPQFLTSDVLEWFGAGALAQERYVEFVRDGMRFDAEREALRMRSDPGVTQPGRRSRGTSAPRPLR